MENLNNKKGTKNWLKPLALIALFAITIIGFLGSSTTFKSDKSNLTFATTSPESVGLITYLKTPQLIATDGTNLFVYDKHTKLISKIDTTTKKTLATSTEEKEILQIKAIEDAMFVLAKDGDSNKIFQLQVLNSSINFLPINAKMPNPTMFDITKTDYYYTLYLIDSSLVINREVLNVGETATSNQQSFVPSQYTTEFGTNVKATNLLVSGTDIYLSYTDESDAIIRSTTIKLTLSPSGESAYYKTETTEEGSAIYYYYSSGENFSSIIASTETNGTYTFLTASNTIILDATNSDESLKKTVNISDSVKSNSTIFFEKVELSSLTFLQDKIYFTDPANQVIFVYGTSSINPAQKTIEVFLANTSPTPEIQGASVHKYIEVDANCTAELFNTPFAIDPLFTLNAGTRLTIIAEDQPEFAGFYYCIYTTENQNHYLYLKKGNNVKVLSKTPVSTPAKVLGSNNTPLFSLPSSKTDSKNTVIENLTNNTEVTQVVLQIVKNSQDESFYCITTPSGNTGYIRYTQLSLANSQIATKKVKCNGRTKRDTTMYLSPSADSKISYSDEQIAEFETLDITNNTRVKLLEEISASKQFIKAIYQNDGGQIFVGYLKTEDIKTDKLTPLQIVGIVLVAINIVLLLVIIFFRKSFTKKNSSTQSSNYSVGTTSINSSTNPTGTNIKNSSNGSTSTKSTGTKAQNMSTAKKNNFNVNQNSAERNNTEQNAGENNSITPDIDSSNSTTRLD